MTKQAAFHEQKMMTLPFYSEEDSTGNETRLYYVDIVKRVDGKTLVFVRDFWDYPVADWRVINAAALQA